MSGFTFELNPRFKVKGFPPIPNNLLAKFWQKRKNYKPDSLQALKKTNDLVVKLIN